MDDPVTMRFVQRLGDLNAVAEGLLHRQRTLFQPLLERFAFDELHYQVISPFVMTDVVERADVRIAQRGNGARFAIESLPKLGIGREMRGKDFQRDDAVEARVGAAIHLAHAARADRCDDFIRPEARARRDGHGFRRL